MNIFVHEIFLLLCVHVVVVTFYGGLDCSGSFFTVQQLLIGFPSS